jgi:hypothetical protein
MNALEMYYPLLGKVVVRFQEVDMLLCVLMACLLNEDPNVTLAFMITLPFSKKLDVFGTVARAKFTHQDLLDKLDKAISLLSSAEEGRNRVVHAAWIGSVSGNSVFFHKPRASRKEGMQHGGIRQATQEEVESVINKIQIAMSAVCQFGRELEQRKIIKVSLFGPIGQQNQSSMEGSDIKEKPLG